MADISVSRNHTLNVADAGAKLATLVDKFKGEYGSMIETVDWNAEKTSAVAKGKMFSATFGVTATTVNCDIDLNGFAAKMAKGMIQGKVEKAVAEGFPA